ncbi:MAG: metallophosphatase family protein [Candidatus Omnitrophica bacterium]|nr:metallophosphatase family protein [Candidatus Omnitrophota bacterium]MBU1808350.1 metallophosphatase family protein [Candidatus Omnitrophota bacterium]
MKIAVFADIHGNIYAFEKVVAALRRESCDLYCFAGDICGYYYYQNDIIDIMRGMTGLLCVAGNHDDAFLNILKASRIEKSYADRYGASSSLLKKTITDGNIEYLKAMPNKRIIKNEGIGMFHGSPWNCLNGYVYPTDEVDRFAPLHYRFIILGHTHYPMVRKIENVCIVNPGSCGQPRDYNMPSYAVIDTKTGEISIKRVSYDHRKMVKDVMDRKEKYQYLVEVLKRGRDDRVS